MCNNFLGMESNLTKKITTKLSFYILGYFYSFFNFIFIVTFFQSCYLIFDIQKVALNCKEQKKKRIMTIGGKTKMLFKVKKCPKNAKNPKK